MSVMPFLPSFVAAPGALPLAVAPGGPSPETPMTADPTTPRPGEVSATTDPAAGFAPAFVDALAAAMAGVAAAVAVAPPPPPAADPSALVGRPVTPGASTRQVSTVDPSALVARPVEIGVPTRQSLPVEPSVPAARTGDPAAPPQVAVAPTAASATPTDAPARPDLAVPDDSTPAAAPATPVLTTIDGSTHQTRRVDAPELTGRPTTSDGSAVVRQVGAVVERVVSRGNGTHRISLTLQPEHLGEVRVTLVVRDGNVRVDLAATGGEGRASEILRNDLPELQRLLESTGTTDARLTVRDLPSSPPSDARTPGPATTDPDSRGARHAPDREASAREHPDRRPPPEVVVPNPTTRAAVGRLDRTV